MKISIITVTLNNKAGLIRAIESVRSQTYKNVEHIIVDGGSTDGSKEILRMENGNQKTDNYSLVSISEADSGIYDAINKGIKLATGDVIGLLHSDDYYKDESVLEKYAEAFEQRAESREQVGTIDSTLPTTGNQLPAVDAVYSDLVYVRNKSKVSHRDGKPKSKKSKNEYIDHSKLNIEDSVVRYWKALKTANEKNILRQVQEDKPDTKHYLQVTTRVLLKGWMPPHPTLFIRKNIFEKYGLYRTDMKIAADYEMVLRLFYKYKITSNYLPVTTYCMGIGGASNKSLKNILLKSKEDYFAMKIHCFPNPIKSLIYKNSSKLTQFIKR